MSNGTPMMTPLGFAPPYVAQRVALQPANPKTASSNRNAGVRMEVSKPRGAAKPR
jgi:hypothetical protein